MTSDQYAGLFRQLLAGKLSPGDAQILIDWLGTHEQDPTAAELIMQQLQTPVSIDKIDPAIIARLESKLPYILAHSAKTSSPVVQLFRKSWLRYAAVLIVLLGATGVYFQLNHQQPQQEKTATQVVAKTDIAPGKNGAILTLSDGSKMVLDSLGNGVIADQNGAKVSLANGQLKYATNATEASNVAYNSVTTPKGRQFQIMLPDGTKVWLNAASSLRYPTTFSGNIRNVEMTGEVYFEVAKNTSMPFHVTVNDKTEVDVLGTHFNINAYQNEESLKTTLLEGSVRVSNGDEKILLKPGQQAQVSGNAHMSLNKDVDTDKVMAWKNGVFDFNDATLEQVMRQLERWYDIDVVYEKGVPSIEFIGKMQKNLSLSEVLQGLRISKVHFRIEGRKLIVMP
ncbi:FecR family protein [Pinibacter soli]|uniref:FecR domain-containing protein n=1 Tax=Pinibacter soli TaxID=3044211 RepID=A0ABT6R6E6_9BACT|nr:FecR family protein [Pinibacter soli]MDI3318138.1 FecR domain-containing protein [Pinibacter soli]